MKTNFIKLIIILFYIGGFNMVKAQGLYNLATLDEEYGDSPLKFNTGTNYDDVYDAFDDGVEWADYTIGGSAGFGWSDNDGTNQTSFCLGAEFLTKILGEDQNPNGAGYLGAFGAYHKASSDGYDESLFRAGVKFSYFDRISALNESQLIYGVKAFYDTGSLDFSGFNEDVTGYGASAYVGINFRLCNKVSIGIEAPVLSYLNRTFEANGADFKTDTFSAAINKDNPLTATVRYNFRRSMKFAFGGKDTDGDGIYDKDDECPKVPGLPEFNGCPDSDGDGIADSNDECPKVPGTAEFNGCPDTDGDGIADQLDKCPNEPGTVKNKGCPETINEDN